MRQRILLFTLLAVAVLGAGLWLLRGVERSDETLLGEGPVLPAEPASASARLNQPPAAQQEADASETAEDATAIEESPTAPRPAQAPPTPPVVVSQPPKAGPVRLFGTITTNGEPAAVQIGFIDGSVMSRTDSGGSYEFVWPKPSERAALLIQLEESVFLTVNTEVRGPIEQRFDVEIPVGGLEGRVHGPDGPLGRVPLVLQHDDRASIAQQAKASATSDAEGRYAFDMLPAGVWQVQAGGGSAGGALKPSFYGPVEVRNVVIEGGQRVTGIDLHLHVAGIVSGRVLTGEGKPAKDAVIWVRRPSGDVVERFPTHVDFHGRFAIGGLEPGWNTLAALDGPQRCVEVAVAVEAFVESHVELRLAPATLARLLVRDVPGVTEKVSCRRSDGADFSKWAGGFDSFAPPGEQRIGPLPPGTYTFTVEREPEPPSSQTVIIADEKEVVLVL